MKLYFLRGMLAWLVLGFLLGAFAGLLIAESWMIVS